MKIKHLLLASVVFTLSISLIFTSCDKDDDDDDTTDTTISVDNAIAEAIFSEIQNITDQASEGNDLTTYVLLSNESIMGGCATVNLNLVDSPYVLTIDFGATNCLCKDNRYRRGKIIATFTGAYRDSGTVITHSFDNYHVNDFKVTGSRTVTNNGRNSSGNLSYTIIVNSTIEKPNNGGTITWNSNRTREWIEGDSTILNWLDDVYLISGSANGVSSNGTAYTINITKPLRVEISCDHIVSGTFELTPSGVPTRTIDYGDGTCDNIATVTVNNITITFKLG